MEEGLEVRVLDKYRDHLMNLPNVVGVGLGYKVRAGISLQELGIVVFVTQKLPADQLIGSSLILPQYDGVVTDVVESGKIATF